MNTTHKENRISYFDLSRGIAIILMVIGHLITEKHAYNLIYSFHLPLYIIISGYFFKEKVKFHKLLLLYSITISIQIMVCFQDQSIIEITKKILITILLSVNEIPTGVSTWSIGALWFFAFIISSKLLFRFNTFVCKKNEKLLIILCFIECTTGFLLSKFNLWLPWHLDVALYSMLWFYIGYKLHKKDCLESIIDNNRFIIPILGIWLLGSQFVEVDLASRSYIHVFYNIYILPIIVAICGFFSIIWLSKRIENHSVFLKYCGQKSGYFIVAYVLFTWPISLIPNINFYLQLFLCILVSFIGTLLIDNIIKLILKIKQI